jgi:translation initiation factor eIF-2B subunit alpha
MEKSEILKVKRIIAKFQAKAPQTSLPVLVVRALVQFTAESQANTYAEYSTKLQAAAGALKQDLKYFAGVDLFMKLLTSLNNVHEFKERITQKCKDFELEYKNNLQRCVDYGLNFIENGQTILLHSYSRLAISLLIEASKSRQFRLVITRKIFRESAKDSELEKELIVHKIPFSLISDASIGYCMEKVDFVLVGAEGVTRNGGILNEIGTLPMAIVAHHMNKPFYCIAERQV